MTDQPTLKLIGTDGNAFAVLGKAKRAADAAGWSRDRWADVRNEAMAGNYDHLLGVIMAHFDVR